jgi:two-component system, NarL family, sensor histidine kinase UhpB
MSRDKSKSKQGDELSVHAEKPLKGKKIKSFESNAEEDRKNLLRALNEREKELNCLYSLSRLLDRTGITLEGIFEGLVNLIPLAWQYPEIACTRIIYGNKEVKANNFEDTKWKQSADVMFYGVKAGCVEVCYLEEKPESYEGPFLKGERDLLEMVAEQLGRTIERKKMEELLRESEYRFRGIFEFSPQAIVLTGFETGKILDVNRKLCELTGYDRREFLGSTSIEIGFFTQEERKAFIGELKSKNYVHELEKDFMTKNGSVLNLLMFSRIIETASDNYILSIFIDITERKRAEEELLRYRMHLEEMVMERTAEMEKANKGNRLYQKRMEALINSSKDFISLKDKDFKYLIANKAYEDIFNIEVSYIIGKTDFDCMPLELASVTRKTDEQALKSEDPVESEAYIGQRVFHVVTQRCIDEEGEIIGIVAIMRDITAHKSAENELTEAKDRFQTLSGSLLRIMEDQRRHIARELHDDIGQQLTLLRIRQQKAQQLSYAKEFRKHLNENMAIVESLIHIVRNLSLELRPSILDDLGLVPALRFCVSRIEKETGKLIDFAADSLPHRFSPDIENACFRVAQESLTNAIKHAEAQRVAIELRQTGKNLRLTIFDDGVGFDVQSALEQAKMGKSFGLLGIHERIFLIGGTIKFESTPGKGTRIEGYFPLREDP